MYKCREVECPYCGHAFMWMSGAGLHIRVYEYMLDGVKEHLEDTECPMCGKICLIKTGILMGLKEDAPGVRKLGIRGI